MARDTACSRVDDWAAMKVSKPATVTYRTGTLRSVDHVAAYFVIVAPAFVREMGTLLRSNESLLVIT